MPPENRLYDTVLKLLQYAPWRDRRHLAAVSWMVVGLLSSGWIALSEWTAFVVGRAQYAQSSERRFQRWLANPRIDVLQLYAAVLRGALVTVEDRRLLVALDSTVLWNQFCVVQVSLVYRGRGIPLVWKVLKHPSASVAFRDYRGVLGFAARLLKDCEVVLLRIAVFCMVTYCVGVSGRNIGMCVYAASAMWASLKRRVTATCVNFALVAWRSLLHPQRLLDGGASAGSLQSVGKKAPKNRGSLSQRSADR